MVLIIRIVKRIDGSGICDTVIRVLLRAFSRVLFSGEISAKRTPCSESMLNLKLKLIFGVRQSWSKCQYSSFGSTRRR